MGNKNRIAYSARRTALATNTLHTFGGYRRSLPGRHVRADDQTRSESLKVQRNAMPLGMAYCTECNQVFVGVVSQMTPKFVYDESPDSTSCHRFARSGGYQPRD